MSRASCLKHAQVGVHHIGAGSTTAIHPARRKLINLVHSTNSVQLRDIIRYRVNAKPAMRPHSNSQPTPHRSRRRIGYSGLIARDDRGGDDMQPTPPFANKHPAYADLVDELGLKLRDSQREDETAATHAARGARLFDMGCASVLVVLRASAPKDWKVEFGRVFGPAGRASPRRTSRGCFACVSATSSG